MLLSCLGLHVDQLILAHHGHEDKEIDKIELLTQKEFPGSTAAYEGLKIDLG